FRKSTAADVGFMNGGSVRADSVIGPGKLTMRDLLSILPFKNKLVKIEVTGATLRAALEHGVSRSAEDSQPGGFPQVSGIQFSFDARRPSGARLVDVKVNGLPLDDAKKYTLTTTTFIGLDGGDGYTMFKGATVVIPPERMPIDSDVVRKAIGTRPIAPKVEGRIKRLDVAQTSGTKCN
ncbi:MAG TPA: 5'-nucleotidase, partial [Pyrinomonadaceae bacterium]|nr:5'-nucleotidase [Pyrinomonadaceae bacterium]